MKTTTKKKEGIVISLSEAIELRQTSTSSVELKRNSKGGTEFVVKVYDSDVTVAKDRATKTYLELNKKFPGE
jgi:hypothetical protein